MISAALFRGIPRLWADTAKATGNTPVAFFEEMAFKYPFITECSVTNDPTHRSNWVPDLEDAFLISSISFIENIILSTSINLGRLFLIICS
jgi:hypothetical protein